MSSASPRLSSVDRAYLVGVIGKTLLAGGKLFAGLASGSIALTADGWHSLSDVVTNSGAWIASAFARRPPDDDHHYGHGNAEALAGVLIGATLVAGGAAIAWDGFLARNRSPDEAHGLALAVAGVSIAANAWLTRLATRVGRAARSQGLLALARDNLSDTLTGGLVFVAILASHLGLAWAEPVAAVAIGGLIVFLGLRSLTDGVHVLMDRVSDPGLRAALEAEARGVDGVRDVQRVRVHPLGDHVLVDLEISVDGGLSVDRGHAIAHAVEAALRRARDEVGGVHVHVNPYRPGEAAEPGPGGRPGRVG